MDTKQLIVSSFLAVFGSASLAAEATEFSIPASTLSRAEVRAELARARSNGELVSSAEADQRPFGAMASTLTRAEVMADLARARASGELVSSQEAEQRPFALANSARTRDDVRIEGRTFARSGTVDPLYVGG